VSQDHPWIVVPVKALGLAKQRLAGVLSAEERRRLVLAMFEDVLETTTAVPDVAGTIVVTRDAEVSAIAAAYGVRRLAEEHGADLNAALQGVAAALSAEGASGMMVLPADVPLASARDLGAVLACHGAASETGAYGLTLVPDRKRQGSNALACSPPNLIEFAYGPGSFTRHLEAGERAGAATRTVVSPSLALDIDTPEDLALAVAGISSGGERATGALVAELDLKTRLLGAGERWAAELRQA
jgi:2-phospho-L-lactate guanylyltransferase